MQKNKIKKRQEIQKGKVRETKYVEVRTEIQIVNRSLALSENFT